MKNKNIIDLQKISTIYEGEKIPVIRDVDLSIETGEFVSIIGPNGAGKTTLLETINGLLEYSEGFAEVFGKEIKKKKNWIRTEIGYVVQNFEIDPLAPFLCKDIVMSGRAGKIGLFRFPSKQDWEQVWQSMSMVGMIDFAKRPIGKLSGGEFQKILLARALAQTPQLLLLDEPFSNLDFSARKQMETLLNRIHEQKDMTIVMVSHDLSFVPDKCRRVIVMNKGRIIMDDKKEKILQSDIINQIFSDQSLSKDDGG
ncbi:MAG: metal ABC transporter ATP-binding protein [Candidatus Thermoplasmatota archaeon]